MTEPDRAAQATQARAEKGALIFMDLGYLMRYV